MHRIDSADSPLSPAEWYARYQSAFHDGPAPMSISTYAEGRFIDVNNSFLRMIGFAREDLIGQTSYELRFWYDHADRRALLRKLEANDGLLRFEPLPLRTKQGERLWTDVSAQATEIGGMPCLLIIYDEHSVRHQRQSARRPSRNAKTPTTTRPQHPANQVADAELREALLEAVAVIERTRHSFKSKQLADLRHRLQRVLKKPPAFRTPG